ncbi:MAG TPA: ATP-binding protein, partial [Holophagaceae bacterium]|nr:ATP-binding protein [Holophagaceae bacterium]
GGWAALRTPWESADPRGQDFLETVDSRGKPSYWMGGFTWGLARFKAGTWSRWEKAQGLPDNRVRCLFAYPGAQDQDDLWVGCNEGLAHLQGARWTVFREKDGLPSNTIRCLDGQTVDGRRIIWAGTSSGLVRLENGRVEVLGRKDGLPDPSIRCLVVDGARLWIGTDSGIACLEGGRIRSYGTKEGLSNQSIASLHLESDAPGGPLLWVGTYGGGVNLVRERPAGLEVRVLGEHTTPALPSEVVDSVEKDRAGRIYLFTNHGVARLRRDGQAAGGFHVETYALEDGLPGLECLVGASMVDRSGRLWAGTVDGMAIFDPGAEFVDRSPKRLRIEGVSLDGRPIAMDQRQRIDGRNHSFAFDYTLLSYHREGETRFRTQLEGLEENPTDWQPGSRREFPHLPSGRYVFKVWGRDFAGNVSGPQTFAFTVPPSPWASWWAVLLYTLAALGLLDLAARWRHRVLAQRTRELEAKVAERTEEVMHQAARLEALNQDLVRLNMEKNEFMGIAAHDLRNPLANITLLAEALSEAEELFTPEERRNRLQQMAEKSHEMAEILGKLLDVNAIEAGRLNLSFSTFDLLPLVKEVLQDFEARAQAKGITLHLQHERQVLEVYAADLQVKQVLENLVSNAVKYSPPHRSVWVALAELPQAVFLQVKDEGIGLTDSDKHKVFNRFTKLSARPTGGESSTGLGLSIARRLVEAMHGRIWVESESGKGSAFCVELPKPL